MWKKIPRGPRCLFIMGNFYSYSFFFSPPYFGFSQKSLIDVLFLYFYFAPRNLAFPFSHRKEASTTKVNGMFFFLLHDFGFPKSLKTYVGRKEKKISRVIFIRLLHNFILFVKEMKISYHLPTKSTSILEVMEGWNKKYC